MQIRIAEKTDVGTVREHNEDAVLAINTFDVEGVQALLVIADGMGGHAAGEVAANIAADTFKEKINNLKDTSPESISEFLINTFVKVNNRIHTAVVEDESKSGMGTTLAVGLIVNDHLYYSWVGDSRGYITRDKIIQQITDDHSLVNEFLKYGMITREEAEDHPRKNVITRCITGSEEFKIDNNDFPLQDGDRIIFCSDGLTEYLSANEIASILFQRDVPEQACEDLINAANTRGGKDNISVAVAYVGSKLFTRPAVELTRGEEKEIEEEEVVPEKPEKKKKKLKNPRLFLIAVLFPIILIAILWTFVLNKPDSDPEPNFNNQKPSGKTPAQVQPVDTSPVEQPIIQHEPEPVESVIEPAPEVENTPPVETPKISEDPTHVNENKSKPDPQKMITYSVKQIPVHYRSPSTSYIYEFDPPTIDIKTRGDISLSDKLADARVQAWITLDSIILGKKYSNLKPEITGLPDGVTVIDATIPSVSLKVVKPEVTVRIDKEEPKPAVKTPETKPSTDTVKELVVTPKEEVKTPKDAISQLTEIIRKTPDDFTSRLQRGLEYFKKGMNRQAKADFNYIIENDSSPAAEAYLGRGLVSMRDGDTDSAKSDFNEAIKLNGKLKEAWYYRGGIQNSGRDMENDYYKAIEIDPNYIDALKGLADYYHKKHDNDKTIQFLNRIIALDSKDANIFYSRALAYFEKEEFEKAITDCDSALKLNSNLMKATRLKDSARKKMNN